MSSKEPIHSGHFMTSNPHNESQADDEDEDDVEVDVVDVDETSPEAQIEKPTLADSDEKPVTFYKFGPQKTQSIAIDVSLNKLNKCIKVAYMKMTTPKWKDFKGLKLQWKHRIRLNNVIWRAYYMEFRKPDKKRNKPYCYFAVPDDDTTHTKIEGTVLEGMYWKRRMEAVCAQYKKWRAFNRHVVKKKPRGCCRRRENSCGCDEKVRQISRPPQSQTPKNMSTMDEDFDFDEFQNEFTDSLFESLNNGPFLFPNPKESVQTGNADIMQPGLLSLQPSIDEIMSSDYFSDELNLDSLEPSMSLALPHREPPKPQGNFAPMQGSSGPMQGSSSAYSTKEYDAANMLVNYSQHPTRQSSAIPTPGLMSSQAQPLYSQAVYTPRGLNDGPHHLPSGLQQCPPPSRTASSIGSMASAYTNPCTPQSVDSVTGMSRSASVVSQPTSCFDYVPQILAAAGVSTAAAMSTLNTTASSFPFIGASNSFSGQETRSRFVVEQPSPNLMTTQHSWWTNVQQQNQQVPQQQQLQQTYQLQERKPQMLRSPTIQPTTQQAAFQSSLIGFNNPPATQPTMQQFTGLPHASSGQFGVPGAQQTIKAAPLGSNAQNAHSVLRGPPDMRQQMATTINDLSRYLPQTATASTPSASLASILSSNSRTVMDNTDDLYAEIVQSRQNEQAMLRSAQVRKHSAKGYPGEPEVKQPRLYESPFLGGKASAPPAPIGAFSTDSSSRKSSLNKSGQATSGNAPGIISPRSRTSATARRSNDRSALSAQSAISPVPQLPSAPSAHASDASPPLQYTQMSLLSQQPSSVSSASSSGSSSAMDMSVPGTSSITIKEERKDDITALTPSGSRRRGIGSSRSAPADSTLHPEERKRILHLHAEKNRRCALKDGFDMLVSAIPDVDEAGVKTTNAVVLNRGAQHIRKLKAEEEKRAKEVEDMKEKISKLNTRIAMLQSNLPSSRSSESSVGGKAPNMEAQIQQFFERHTKDRSRQDYRFWLMAHMMKPLVQSYASSVHPDPANKERVAETARAWLAQKWNLGELRPLASQMLVYLATDTGVLTNPETLPDYVMKQISKPT